jgi:hypothetical protein
MQSIEECFEEKARAGDGSFAVAFALLQVAQEQKAIAKALQNIGISESEHHVGALEKLAMNVARIAETPRW